MTTVLSLATTIAAVGAAVAGGVYLAFAAMVLPALRRLPAGAAVATMQRINEHALRAPFMVVFFGGAAAALAVVVGDLVGDDPSSVIRMVGAGLALAGFLLTTAVNVPLNTALARLDPAAPDLAGAWASFERRWAAANLVRGIAAMAGSAALVWG